MVVDSCQCSCSFQLHQKARVKNVEGGPGDEDPSPPPHLPSEVKGKATKKLTSKKQKYADADTVRAAAVAAAVERAERGGARSGV